MFDMLQDGFLQKEYGTSCEWLPVDTLGRIFQPVTVELELRQHFQDDADVKALVNYVCGNSKAKNGGDLARRILATLLLIKSDKSDNVVKEYLPRLRAQNITDKHLPLTWASGKFNRDQYLLRQGNPEQPVTALGLKPSIVRGFYNNQWSFHVPQILPLTENFIHHYPVHKEAIFPWIFYEPLHRESTYGDVARVKIHPAHHGFKVSYSARWAIFEVHSLADKLYRTKSNSHSRL